MTSTPAHWAIPVRSLYDWEWLDVTPTEMRRGDIWVHDGEMRGIVDLVAPNPTQLTCDVSFLGVDATYRNWPADSWHRVIRPTWPTE